MGVKIKKKLDVLTLIDRSKESFKDNLEKVITPEIIQTIQGGASPIKAGRQQKYSQSYIDQIEGRVKFYTGKGGGTYAVKPGLEHGEFTPLSFSKKGKMRKGKEKKAKMKKFEKGLGHGKLKSPVNLKVTGALHKSIKTARTEQGLLVYFDDPKLPGSIYSKSEIHNDIGVGPSEIKRRLLPTNEGEEFNRNIFNRIMEAIKKAVKENI